MSKHDLYEREASISSERTLDNLENIPSNLPSPLTSPYIKSNKRKKEMADRDVDNLFRPGSSKPPHHNRGSPVPMEHYHGGDGERGFESEKIYKSRVSWQSPPAREEGPGGESRQATSHFTFEYEGASPVRDHSGPPERGTVEMTRVGIGSDSSPIRRLKRKEEIRPVEREYSEAYIDSISRTPRYSLGRHNTYDDMLDSLNSDDPFKGQYQPSGKSPRDKASIPKPKHHKHKDEDRHDKSKKKNKKRKKKKDDSENERQETSESYTNEAFVRSPSKRKDTDRESVGSTGTYTLKDHIRASATNLAAPVMKNSPQKVISVSKIQDGNKTREELDQAALAAFISKNKIMQRECKDYILDPRSKTNNCMCGRDQIWHEMRHIDIHKHSSKHIWHHHTHSETFPVDSFGVIQFQGFGQEAITSPYIRLSPDTDLETVWSLVTDHWKLPIPKLLISVTGGAQRFDLNPRLKAVFKRGLINAATTTGAWIITGGTATGVMRFVGEAVRVHLFTQGANNNRIIAMGMASWGCIANRESLDGEGDQGLFPASYSLEDVQEVKGRDVPLDHNHTHFILVDNGTDGKFGGEIEFRAAFEHFVSEKVATGVAEAQCVNVPVVMLVVEGGVNTMLTVWKAIEKNIPVLVLNGSGRAADFIACGYNKTKDPKNEDKSKFPSNFNEEMKYFAKEVFAWKSADNVDKKISECIKQLRDTLGNRKLVNIFNLGEADTKDIDRAILYALLKANKTNAKAQLSLALAWNRCDIARHEIFTNENRQYWRNIPLYDAMFTALVQDRVDFVHLFLENGVSLKKFLSIETLWNLYGVVLNDNTDTMAQLLNNLILYLKQTWMAYFLCQDTESSGSDPDLLCMVGKLMVHLLGDENFNPYTGERFRVTRKSAILRWLAGNHESRLSKKGGLSTLQSVDSAKRFFKRKRYEYDFDKMAERELFLWAILFNRRELGKMLWRSGQDQLGAALVACATLKALSSVASDDEELELSQDLLDHANMYEDMAVGVLSECYKKDKMMAHQCLVRRLENFGRTTVFTLADTHTLMKFMEHTSCQTKLNLIWKGRMALYTPSWKILLSLVFPFFVPTIKFTTNEGLVGSDDEDEYDDLDEGEEPVETLKEDVHIISNKVHNEEKQHSSKKVLPNVGDDSKAGDEIFVRSAPARKKHRKKKLYKIQLRNDGRTNSIGILNAYYCFYTAPVSVFILNTISYLFFLGLFTYFVLTDLYAHHLSVYEYIVWGWTITMLIEELRQVLANDKRSLYYKIRSWFGSMWNRFDLAMYVIFIVSVTLRFTLNDRNFTYCRICYSITVAMYYLRFMQVFFVEKNIGPKVIMITNMVIDLVFFLGIFLFFLLSFGIMYQANLFPNSPPSWHLLKSVFYIPYWQMYGELFLENLEGEEPQTCTKNESIWRPAGGKNRCPEENALVPLLGAIYLILTNILLVNLLIAMFSYTFQMVQDKSEQVWRFYRYSLVHEFYDRPKFCPPFIIISHIYRSILFIVRKSCSTQKYTNEFKLNLDEKDNNRITLFVRSATENYLNISHQAQKEELGTKVADTANRIERVIEELDSIKEQVKITRSPLVDESRPGTAEPWLNSTIDSARQLSSRKSSNLHTTVEILEERMNDLGDQVNQTNLQISQMMTMLQSVFSQQRLRSGQLEINDVSEEKSHI